MQLCISSAVSCRFRKETVPCSIMESKVVVIFSIWAVLFGQLATIVRGANILYISIVASPSHFLWSQRLFERLAEVGHNVTVVNLYKEGVVRGVHLLKLDGVIADLESKEDDEEDYVEFGQLNPFEMHVSFAELELQVCELAIRSTTFRRLFDNSRNSQIDLVIHDHLAGPCLLALMPVFNYPPLILASAYNRISTTSSPMGTLIFPGFIPNQVYDVDEPMSFFNRCFNVVLSCWEILFKEFVYYPKLDKLVKTALNQSDRVSDLEKRALLAILNSGTLLEHPEPTTKNVIQVGGLHIKPTKPLPTDLIKIIDSASEGFVLLSLGTNARSDSLDSTILIEIISAMNALSNITFLWKLDSENCLPVKLPHNVFTSAWLPQNDLLAHPKIRLFITHGGLLSTQEAVWHGVPIVGLPIYADQFGNINQLVRKGVGRRLSIVNLKSHQLIESLDEIIRNESYKENAMQLSQLLRDRKVTSLDDAVWSIEWVLRNANTSHVWNQSLVNLGFLQKHSYDVVAAFVCILMLIASILLLVILRGVHMLIKEKNKSKIE